MAVAIIEEPLSRIGEHAQVAIAFEVACVLDVRPEDAGLSGLTLLERPLTTPYRKDYDAIPGNHPTEWARQFDLSNWVLLTAQVEGSRVGGLVVAFRSSDVDMLEDRNDLAVIWDLRISPEMRRHRIASALLAAAEQWAKKQGCRQLKVETQNINVPACKFYANRGFELGVIRRFAYPKLPEEVQLIWYKVISASSA